MVLDASDYRLPSPGSQYNPLKLNTYARLAGFMIVASMLLWAFFVARGPGVSFMDSLVARIPVLGRRLQARGSQPRRF